MLAPNRALLKERRQRHGGPDSCASRECRVAKAYSRAERKSKCRCAPRRNHGASARKRLSGACQRRSPCPAGRKEPQNCRSLTIGRQYHGKHARLCGGTSIDKYLRSVQRNLNHGRDRQCGFQSIACKGKKSKIYGNALCCSRKITRCSQHRLLRPEFWAHIVSCADKLALPSIAPEYRGTPEARIFSDCSKNFQPPGDGKASYGGGVCRTILWTGGRCKMNYCVSGKSRSKCWSWPWRWGNWAGHFRILSP